MSILTTIKYLNRQFKELQLKETQIKEPQIKELHCNNSTFKFERFFLGFLTSMTRKPFHDIFA